jgi:hypothetical protein
MASGRNVVDVLARFPHRAHQRSIDRDKVEGVFAAHQLAPVHRRGLQRNRGACGSNCAQLEGQESIVHEGDSDRLHMASDRKRIDLRSEHIDAAHAVLQHGHQGWIVISERALHANPLRAIFHVEGVEHFVHPRNRDGPGIPGRRAQHAQVVRGRCVQQDAGLLHLSVEAACGHAGDLHLGVEPPFQRRRIAVVHGHRDKRAGDGEVNLRHWPPGAELHMGRLHHSSYNHVVAIELGRNHLGKLCRNWRRHGAVMEERDIAAHHAGAKIRKSSSAHQDTVARGKRQRNGRVDINGVALVLDEHG